MDVRLLGLPEGVTELSGLERPKLRALFDAGHAAQLTKRPGERPGARALSGRNHQSVSLSQEEMGADCSSKRV